MGLALVLQNLAGKVPNLSSITKTTVSALRSKTVLRGLERLARSGVESIFYEVKARLVSAKLEEDDDIHLVIKGMTTSGMMVEFRTVACSSTAARGAKTRMTPTGDVLGNSAQRDELALTRLLTEREFPI